MRRSRPARRAHLVVHVLASAGRPEPTAGPLALGVTTNTSGSAAAVEACVRAMRLFAGRLRRPPPS